MRTPLYEEHRKLGAKMTEFAGWEMPLYYSGIVHEVQAVRTSAGIFDLSHMGEVWFEGPDALDTAQLLTTNDVSMLEPGAAQYTLMCDDSGGVLDDLIVYRVEPDRYMLVVNASNIAPDFEWMQSHNSGSAALRNESDETALIAVQGPCAADIVQELVDFNVGSVARFHGVTDKVAGFPAWVARTGYTGEDGFEIYIASDHAAPLWQALMEKAQPYDALPVGLGARDVLRLEAGYPLYGNELSRNLTPVEARLMWVVKLAKGDFVGREAIAAAKKAGPRQLLIGLEALESCVPRHGYSILSGQDEIGEVTSGTFSPTLQKSIAMGYVTPRFSELDTKIDVLIRGRKCPCKVVPASFYRCT